MKFNWGTGIFLFLTVFLLACAVFITFAFRQDVNLVHEDYYQKGVDYTDQMETEARSVAYYSSFNTYLDDGYFVVEFEKSLTVKMDSGVALLYRPSDSKEDISFKIDGLDHLAIPTEDLISGRYILKMYWYSDGLKYEVDKPVNIQ
jgi:hypothetical protein